MCVCLKPLQSAFVYIPITFIFVTAILTLKGKRMAIFFHLIFPAIVFMSDVAHLLETPFYNRRLFICSALFVSEGLVLLLYSNYFRFNAFVPSLYPPFGLSLKERLWLRMKSVTTKKTIIIYIIQRLIKRDSTS